MRKGKFITMNQSYGIVEDGVKIADRRSAMIRLQTRVPSVEAR